MSETPNVFAPPPAHYACIDGPPLTLAAEPLQQLQRLADDASVPGAAVSVSDLVTEALAAYLDDKGTKKKLNAIAEQADADELERVALVHGGEAA